MKKGISLIMFLFIFLVVLVTTILVIEVFLVPAREQFETKQASLLQQLYYKYAYSFDKSVLVKGESNAQSYFAKKQDGGDSDFCKALKNCILENVGSGQPCVLSDFDVIYYNLISATDFATYIGECNKEDLFVKEAGGERKVCYFPSAPPVNTLTESSLLYDGYYNPLFLKEPYIHDCQMAASFQADQENLVKQSEQKDFSYEPIYYNPITTTINFQDNAVFFVSPFYYKDYIPAEYEGGKLRMVLSNAHGSSSMQRECLYNLFVCSQPSVAESESDKTLQLFEIFRSLDQEEIRCDNKDKFSDANCGIYPRSYILNFGPGDNKPTVSQIENAIATGLWEWNKMHFSDTSFIKKSFPEPYNTSSFIFFSMKPWKDRFIDIQTKVSAISAVSTNPHNDGDTCDNRVASVLGADKCPSGYKCVKGVETGTFLWGFETGACCPNNYPQSVENYEKCCPDGYSYSNGYCYEPGGGTSNIDSQYKIDDSDCIADEYLKNDKISTDYPQFFFGKNIVDNLGASDTITYDSIIIRPIYFYKYTDINKYNILGTEFQLPRSQNYTEIVPRILICAK